MSLRAPSLKRRGGEAISSRKGDCFGRRTLPRNDIDDHESTLRFVLVCVDAGAADFSSAVFASRDSGRIPDPLTRFKSDHDHLPVDLSPWSFFT